MSYVACMLAFGLRFVWNKYQPRMAGRIPYVAFFPFVLLAIGTMTLANTRVGSWIATAMQAVLGWIGSVAGGVIGVSISASMLASILFALLAIAAIFDLLDLRPDGIAQTAAIALPFLAYAAVGPFATAGAGLFEAVSSSGTDALMHMVGQ